MKQNPSDIFYAIIEWADENKPVLVVLTALLWATPWIIGTALGISSDTISIMQLPVVPVLMIWVMLFIVRFTDYASRL